MTAVDQLLRHKPGLQRQPSRRWGTQGFTILEALVAVLIASSAIALIVPTFIRQLGLSSEANSLTAVESVVSQDLDWISDYARWWKLRSGPYNLSTTVTGASSWTTSPETAYEPPADRCASGTLGNGFLSDMAAVTTSPARPYPIDPASTAAATLATINGVEIRRAIQATANTVQVKYTLAGDKADSLRFWRQASVLIEASAWCERQP